MRAFFVTDRVFFSRLWSGSTSSQIMHVVFSSFFCVRVRGFHSLIALLIMFHIFQKASSSTEQVFQSVDGPCFTAYKFGQLLFFCFAHILFYLVSAFEMTLRHCNVLQIWFILCFYQNLFCIITLTREWSDPTYRNLPWFFFTVRVHTKKSTVKILAAKTHCKYFLKIAEHCQYCNLPDPWRNVHP
jgi:hypothetical protein